MDINLNTQLWQIISNLLVLLGVIVATCTIIYNVRIARKTQTANFLFESRKDSEYFEALHVLKRAHHTNKSFRAYVIPCEGETISSRDMIERRKFQYILNFYERVAVSVRQGIYDEEMLKRVSYSTAVDLYDISEPLIKAIRESCQSETAYQEFEWLVRRWKKNPLQPK